MVQADCVEWLNRRRKKFADLIFADPPFNIGYKYDIYEDRKKYDDYHAWTEQWMAACCKVLKEAGSFWVAIGDDYAAEVRIIGRKLGLHLRNWIIWHYTFGQNTKRKFARSHTHLFYFVNDPGDFTFNDEAVRTFSDRQREYKDKRAHDKGKLPDDVWAEFPRVCGTFDERERWHPCQMPETLLARIIRACSNRGDTILDPLAGSGTTLAVAKKLSRHYVGIEISQDYVKNIEARLKSVTPIVPIQGERKGRWPDEHIEELKALYVESGIGTEKLHTIPHLFQSFVRKLNWRIEEKGNIDGYTPEEVWLRLEKLRKAGKLGRIRVHAREDMKQGIRSLESPAREDMKPGIRSLESPLFRGKAAK